MLSVLQLPQEDAVYTIFHLGFPQKKDFLLKSGDVLQIFVWFIPSFI